MVLMGETCRTCHKDTKSRSRTKKDFVERRVLVP